MGRKTVRNTRPTRADKQRGYEAPQAFIAASTGGEPAIQVTERLKPLTANQAKAIQCLKEGYPVVCLSGSAGVGKSLIAADHAAELLRQARKQKNRDFKIILARPAVAVGKTIGLLPGTEAEKLAPFFVQTIQHLEKFLGKGFTAYCLEKDIIQYAAVEYIRGRSFENCVVITEESQNFTPAEFEMMLTRLGDNATMIFTGDTKQHDLKGESGLSQTLALVSRMLQTHPEYMTREEMDDLDAGFAVVNFTPDDVVRSGLTKALVRMYFHN